MMGRRASRSNATHGFSCIQLLISVAIVVAFAALAIPVYSARAKESVLQQNAHSLELEIRSYLALDLEATFLPGGAAGSAAVRDAAGDDDRSAGFVITRALSAGDRGSSGYYRNPLSGSRAVISQTLPPSAVGTSRPAVWMTDDQRYAHTAFTASSSTRRRLAGTLMVVFLTHGGRVSGLDIFYVDSAGKRSADDTVLPI
jgi:type II secretory pathway pseudopilin PulG